MEIWQMIAVYMIAFAIVGMYVADQKNRSWWEGGILGLLFGPFGPIYVGLLPSVDREVRLRADAKREKQHNADLAEAEEKWLARGPVK